MLEIISLVIPFFAVIGCGYFGARLIGEAGLEGISNLVLYFALPVLIFGLMARSNLADRFPPDFVAAYLTVSILLFGLALITIKRLYQLNRAESAIGAMGAIYGNTGYMGVPILVIAMGHAASIPAVISLVLDVAVMIPLAAAVVESGDNSGGRSLLLGAKRAFLATFQNPLILAAMLGGLWSLSGLAMPVMVNGFLDLLGAAAAPCALFVLGASLNGKQVGHTVSAALLVSGFKLILHPLLLWFAMTQVWRIDQQWVLPAVIAAAMPVAATVFVIASQYRTYVIGSSTAILISTGLSLVSLTALLTILGRI